MKISTNDQMRYEQKDEKDTETRLRDMLTVINESFNNNFINFTNDLSYKLNMSNIMPTKV